MGRACSASAPGPVGGTAKENHMKQGRSTTLAATSIALATTLATALTSSGTAAIAQTTASRDGDSNRDRHSPMVTPPATTSRPGGSDNPDNMPIWRPRTPANDRMTHEPPASGANAK